MYIYDYLFGLAVKGLRKLIEGAHSEVVDSITQNVAEKISLLGHERRPHSSVVCRPIIYNRVIS